MFFEASRIYLPEHICALLEKVISALRRPAIGVFVYGGTDDYADEAVREQKKKAFMAAFEAFNSEIPAVRKALEDEFRKLLGVEKSPLPGSAT